jgi:peptidoglycan/LPS O-acetylase OafA/YrhL
MNPFAISWLWRGFKGKSVTFATLFASLVLGASVAGGFTKLLQKLGFHWLYVLVVPMFVFSFLAKMEPRLIPDETKRKLYARGLIVGSIIVALIIAKLRGPTA